MGTQEQGSPVPGLGWPSHVAEPGCEVAVWPLNSHSELGARLQSPGFAPGPVSSLPPCLTFPLCEVVACGQEGIVTADLG